MRKIKCKNCGKTDVFRLQSANEWHWVRCERCGFHTSSYLSVEDAKKAAELGEHYNSETGNKCFDSLSDNHELHIIDKEK